MPEESGSKAFEVGLMKVRDAVGHRSSLFANAGLLLEASWQGRTKYFFMCVQNDVRAAGSVFRANMSDICDLVNTMAPQRHEDSS